MILELLKIMGEEHKKPEDVKKCPDCGGEIINKNGEKYCKKCGLVIE